MAHFLMVTVYSMKEAGEQLAKLVGRDEPYTKQYISYLIKKHRPEVIEVGNQYLITDYDLKAFKRLRKQPGRPKNI